MKEISAIELPSHHKLKQLYSPPATLIDLPAGTGA